MKRARSGYLVNAGFFRLPSGELAKTNPGFYFKDSKFNPNNMDYNPAQVLPEQAYRVVRTPSKL